MKVSVTFTFRCDNLWKSKFVASGKAWETRWFFLVYFAATPFELMCRWLAAAGGQMNMRRRRGLVHGTDDQMYAVSLPRRFRALYDRILLPLSNFVVRRPHLFFFIFPRKQHQTCNKSSTAQTGQPGIKAWTYSSPIIKCRFLGEKKTIYRNNTFTVLRMIISNR